MDTPHLHYLPQLGAIKAQYERGETIEPAAGTSTEIATFPAPVKRKAKGPQLLRQRITGRSEDESSDEEIYYHQVKKSAPSESRLRGNP